MANVKVVVSGEDRASGMLRNVGASLSSIAAIAGGIIVSQLGIRAVRGLANLSSQAFQAVSDFEALSLSISQLVAKESVVTGESESMAEALKKTADRAAELLQWVNELAIKSPFGREAVAQALQLAQAYDFTTNEAKRLTTATLDFVTATGQSSQMMDRVVRALGQMKTKGKIAGQEILQLTEAGVNFNRALRESFVNVDTSLQNIQKRFQDGVITATQAMQQSNARIQAMIKSGAITTEDAINAVIQSIERDFGGAAENAAESWRGLVETFKDIKDIALNKIFAGILNAFKPLVAELTNFLTGPALQLADELGQSFADFGQNVVSAMRSAGFSVDNFADAIVKVSTNFLSFLASVNFGFLIQQVIKFSKVIGVLSSITGMAFKAMRKAATELFTGFSLFIAAALDGLGLLPGALIKTRQRMRALGIDLGSLIDIASNFRIAIKKLKPDLLTLFHPLITLGTRAIQMFSDIGQSIKKNMIDIIKEGIPTFLQFFNQLFNLSSGLPAIMIPALTRVGEGFASLAQGAGIWINVMLQDVSTFLAWFRENMGPTMESILNNLATIWETTGAAISRVLIALGIAIGVSAIKFEDFFAKTLELLAVWGLGFINIITGTVTALIQALSGDFPAALETLKMTFGSFFQSVLSLTGITTEEFLSSWKFVFDSLPMIIQIAKLKIVEFFMGISQTSQQIVAIVQASIQKWGDGITAWGAQTADKVGVLAGKIMAFVSNFVAAGQAIINGLASGAAAAMSLFFGNVTNGVGNALASALSFAGQFLSTGQTFITSLAAGVMSVFGTLISTISTVGGDAVSTIEAFVGDFAGIGSNMVSALAGAISAGAGAVIQAAADVVAAAVAAAMAAAGIGSPSKEMIALATNMTMTLADTFNNLSNIPEKAAGKMIGGVVDNLQNKLGDFSMGANVLVPAGVTPSAGQMTVFNNTFIIDGAQSPDQTADTILDKMMIQMGTRARTQGFNK